MKVELRDNQPQIVNSIISSFKAGNKVVVLNAPTGVGKSIINMMVTKEIGSGYTTTPLRTLVEQYRDTVLKFDEDELGWVIMGRGGYPCPHLIAIENKRFNKLSETEKAKNEISHEYRLKNMTADGAPCSSSKPRYYVGEGNGTEGRKKQYSKSCPFRSQCPYYQDRDEAMVSVNAISTFDYFMYGIVSQLKREADEPSEQENEDEVVAWKKRDVLTIDEAHSLPEKLVDFFSITISEKSLPDFDRKELLRRIEIMKGNLKAGDNFSSKFSEIFSVMFTEYQNLQSQEMAYLLELAEDDDEQDVEYMGKYIPLSEAIQKHNKFMAKLNFIRSSVNPKVEFVYNADENGIYLKPYSAKTYMEKIWKMFDHILLSSATFFDIEMYLEDLGLNEYKHEIIDVPSSFDAVNGPIIRESNLYLSRKNFDTTIQKVVEEVDKLMDMHKNERGMIHCFSSAYRSAIMKYSRNKERLITHDSFNRSDILKKFTTEIKEGDNSVLVSVNMGEGVDLKDEIARFQIIVKAPFLPIGDPWIALHKERSDRWYKAQTIIVLMQMAGRVVRSKEDYGYTYIIDNNAWTLLERNKSLLPSWFNARMEAGIKEKQKRNENEMKQLIGDL